MKHYSKQTIHRNRSYSSMNHEEYSIIFQPNTPLLKPSQIPDELPNEMMLPPSQNIVELEDISEEEEDVNLKSTSLFQHRHFKSPFDRIKKKRKIDSSELKRNRSQSEYIHSFSILSFLEKEYKKNKH